MSATAPTALVRDLPDTFTDALGQIAGARPIDLTRARAQHAAYRAALARLGHRVVALPADDALPDCCFVEDVVVLIGDRALLTRPGAASRAGEVAAVAAALEAWPGLELHVTPEGARLDGGDVLRVGDVIFVGQSQRTDAGGAAALRRTFAPLGLTVVPVPVPRGVLHLKCHASSPVDGLVVIAEGSVVEPHLPPRVRRVTIPRAEAYAANAVGAGDTLVVAAGFPEAAARLRAEGFALELLDVSEFALADGSLTCLSVVRALASRAVTR